MIQPQTPIVQPVHTSQINTLAANFQPTLEPGNIFNLNSKTKTYGWIIDSGATDHIASSLMMFDYYRIIENVFIKLPNSQTILVTHIGNIHITPIFVLHKVLFASQLTINIMSVNRLILDSPYHLLFHKNRCVIQDVQQ